MDQFGKIKNNGTADKLDELTLHSRIHQPTFPLDAETRKQLDAAKQFLEQATELSESRRKLLDNIRNTLSTDDAQRDPSARWKALFRITFQSDELIVSLVEELSAAHLQSMINLNNAKLNIQAGVGDRELILEVISRELEKLESDKRLTPFCEEVRKHLMDL